MPNKTIEEQFEANFLDGDKINDCGNATFTVIGALDIAEHFYESGYKDGLEHGRGNNIINTEVITPH